MEYHRRWDGVQGSCFLFHELKPDSRWHIFDDGRFVNEVRCIDRQIVGPVSTFWASVGVLAT